MKTFYAVFFAIHGQKMANRPFNLKGVNGVNIQSHNETLVHLKTADERKQLLQVVTFDKTTSETPIFNVESASKDIKNDKATDLVLQGQVILHFIWNTS